MHVLARKPGQRVVVGGVVVVVISCGPGRVRLGVVAPPAVRVERATGRAAALPSGRARPCGKAH
jgi:sRNA-binding carbon storage regulator CsrA